MKRIFTGILPALVTPLCEDNKTVNTKEAKKLIDLFIEQGANGFYILGGTGEGLVIAREEREIMCEEVVKHVNGRQPVINHVAAMNLDETIALAKHAEKVGCDAIASIPPLFFYHDADDLYLYYKKLADSVSIPLVMYYHPSAGAHMSAELVARICQVDNITGVKWSVNNYYEMMRLKDMTQGEINIINGPDEMLIQGLAAGADAGIGSTYNMMLPQFVQIYKAFQEGNMKKALQTQLKVNNVLEVIKKYETIPGVKYGVNLMGYNVGKATFPMRQLEPGSCKEFETELHKVGWPFKEEEL